MNVQRLNDIIDLEKGHQQWEKQFINIAIFLALVLLNIFRGSKINPSIFGVVSGSYSDWGSILIFIIFCGFMTFYSVIQQQKEQDLKIRYGNGLIKSEVKLDGCSLFKLILFSFIGGWVSGALGMGGGSVFNPILLSMGIPPQVSSATGSYMIIFSTGASTLTFVLNDMLNLSYGMWAGTFCLLGTILGMYLMDKLMKKVKRQSP